MLDCDELFYGLRVTDQRMEFRDSDYVEIIIEFMDCDDPDRIVQNLTLAFNSHDDDELRKEIKTHLAECYKLPAGCLCQVGHEEEFNDETGEWIPPTVWMEAFLRKHFQVSMNGTTLRTLRVYGQEEEL